MRTTRAVTLASAASAVALAVVGAGLGVAADGWSIATLIVMSIAVVTTAVVGALIGARVPGHAVGLVLALSALVYGTNFVAEAYARFVVLDDRPQFPGGEWAVLWADAGWATLFAGVVAVALVFPDGQLPSPGWRPIAWGAVVCVSGTVTMSLFSSEPFDEPFGDVERPLRPTPSFLEPLQLVFLLGLVALVVAAGIATRRRFVRAVQPERQQMLWLASSAWLIPATLGVCILDIFVPSELDALVLGMVLLTITAVPVSIAVAVLRYRLYELDRLLNRALVYGVLTALVFAAYYAAVVVFGRLAGGAESLAVTLAATAAVVVAVNPLRTWLQRHVDRLMYGDRSDPYAGLTRLAERLEASVTPQMAVRTIVETVRDSLKVPFVAVDLSQVDGRRRAAAVGGTQPDDAVEVPLLFQGDSIGFLVVGPRPGEELAPSDRRLLGELARHAGAVVHATRLTAELQASRERLVAAQEEVRRRLRRDLHDELGPALAGAVFQVDIARDALPADATEVDGRLEQLRAQLQDAVGSIRDLAYALRPPALDDGLVPAIEQQAGAMNARGSGPVVRLAVDHPLPELSPAVEVAAYRIIMEAVGNAVRHSGASHCEVRLSVDDGLRVEVCDNGTNAEPIRPGVGIASMRERAGELGASLEIDRTPSGTRVHTVLPIGAP